MLTIEINLSTMDDEIAKYSVAALIEEGGMRTNSGRPCELCRPCELEELCSKEIRPPDEPIRECLLPNNDYHQYIESEEEQIRRVMEESESDFEFQFAILESNRIKQMQEERTKHFARFRSKLSQFMRIDSPNREFYSEILYYIAMYEYGELITVTVSDEFYMKFRKTVDNMRLTEEDKTRLNELIKQ